MPFIFLDHGIRIASVAQDRCGLLVYTLTPNKLLFNMQLYVYWVGILQLFWMLAFAIFVVVYAPMLLSARVDGRDG